MFSPYGYIITWIKGKVKFWAWVYRLKNSFRGYLRAGTGVLRMRIILIYQNRGGVWSAVRGSVRLSVALCRPFGLQGYKDTAEKVEPYRGAEGVTVFHRLLALYAGEC